MKILIAAYFATWLMIPWILLARKRPISTLAWIWAVMLFPFVGPIAYLLFGVDRITRARRRIHETFLSGLHGEEVSLPKREARLFRVLAGLCEYPSTTARNVEILPNATAFYPALQKAIEGAQHHIHIIFFIWESDYYGERFRDLLIAAARRGVAVRLLLDRVGSQKTREEFFRPLVEAGGKFAWFRTINPLRRHFSLHLRNHRKLQIIDGQCAFIGGMNMGRDNMGENPELGHWRDVQIKLGGNVIRPLQHVFAEDWFFATDERISGDEYFPPEEEASPHAAQVIIGGPDLECETMAESFIALLNHATRRAWIATGYFAPDERLLSALRLAALRGADVRLLITQKSDHPYLAGIAQSYYETLLCAGVRIFEYTEGINHAKTMLLDEDLLMVGSANCDDRSMRLNFELNILIRSQAAAARLEEEFFEDFRASEELALEKFRQRPFRRKLLEALVRPLAPMT
jgi:cardiolipin synthase A/B